MRCLRLVLVLALSTVGMEGFAATDAPDDDEYEEVVVKRKKKRTKNQQGADAAVSAAAVPVATTAVVVPAVVAVPVITTSVTTAPAAAVQEEEDAPPPEPPQAEAAEPRRLVRYFCKAWKDQDYDRLWWAMSSSYRRKVSLKKFTKLFKGDAESNGGLLDENILETAKTKNGNEGVKVELIFKFPKAKHRFVMAVAERQPGGAFRLIDSPFIPLDLDDI